MTRLGAWLLVAVRAPHGDTRSPRVTFGLRMQLSVTTTAYLTFTLIAAAPFRCVDVATCSAALKL